MPYSEMGWLQKKIGAAAVLMRARQMRMRLGKGAKTLRNIGANAIAVEKTDVVHDPKNGDQILIFHFRDCAPLPVRLSPEIAIEIRERMIHVARETAH